jgi:hypothetical protein
MGFWTNKDDRPDFADAEDLAYPPSGGVLTMWLAGVGLALIPAGYGIHCLHTHHAFLPGDRQNLDVTGSTATALALAYIAIGIFMHAHWFWGLRPKFLLVSQLLKILSILLFLGSLGFGMYKIVEF